jgi:hypothetical protein
VTVFHIFRSSTGANARRQPELAKDPFELRAHGLLTGLGEGLASEQVAAVQPGSVVTLGLGFGDGPAATTGGCTAPAVSGSGAILGNLVTPGSASAGLS